MLIQNQSATRVSYPEDLSAILSIERTRESRRWLKTWSYLSQEPTPIYDLPDLAQQLNVEKISLKDESVRSPLKSFKALGAPIALVRQITRLYPTCEPECVLTGQYAHVLKDYTVISATDGNHGRGLAAAAQDAGCQCVIVLHANVSQEREDAISALGARIIRIPGNYDDSVHEAARLAHQNGWQVISDTSYENYETIPRDVMQGYSIISAEIIEQTQWNLQQEIPFTHVILQGGVGGMAAGIASYLWEQAGSKRPHFIVVEPAQADCLTQSALQGRPAKACGTVDSVMAGLACGEASPLAWRFLKQCIDAFMTIEDQDAIHAMRRLATGSQGDIPIVAGESAAAGLAGLTKLRADASLSGQVGLCSSSRVLVISTEGATAPSLYRELVDESEESVHLRQQAWKNAVKHAC